MVNPTYALPHQHKLHTIHKTYLYHPKQQHNIIPYHRYHTPNPSVGVYTSYHIQHSRKKIQPPTKIIYNKNNKKYTSRLGGGNFPRTFMTPMRKCLEQRRILRINLRAHHTITGTKRKLLRRWTR